MLNNVSTGINSIARNVIMNHPNAFNCEVYRRKNKRVAPEVGGAPTLGGMMVLSVDDESEIAWELVGLALALPADMFQPSSAMDRRDANNGFSTEYRFLIEPEEMLGNPGGFRIEKNDVFYIIMGVGATAAKIAHEIIDVEATLNVPPYVERFVTNRRDDLDLMTDDDGSEP